VVVKSSASKVVPAPSTKSHRSQVIEIDVSTAAGLDLRARAEAALKHTMAALVAKQNAQGYWVGELQGDSILESEYLLLKFILEQDDDPNLPFIANYLRTLQQADGGWNMYPGGASDLSGTVKAYFALKLIGDDINAPHMRAARECVVRLGGAEKCNSFSSFYLAALGQISYDGCPAIPPEIILLPQWLYFNLYAVSAWTRTMILPLAIVSTLRPVRKLPPERGIAELFTDNQREAGGLGLPRSWREIFMLVDRLLKLYHIRPIEGLRQKAIKEAEKWLLEHLEDTQGLGAIFPPMVYILIVFRALGYRDDDPRVLEAQQHLRDLFIKEGDQIRIQPCHSPVWDTGLALHALAEAELDPDSDSALRATQWLLSKECRQASDWRKNCPDVEPSGWFFEFENPHYPDVDDTAMVTMALKRVGSEPASAGVKRGINWLLAMQNDDGGWAAFDRTRNREILEHVPFADHNAMQDPSCPDITGRVLECLGHCGFKANHPAVKNAINFIHSRQETEGCWFGRWGVNYVYGTWQVLVGLRSIGADMHVSWIRKAADWLRKCQKPDGSWGETCDSYEDPSLKGTGASTPSQTAWGLMGIMAVAGPDDPAVLRGVRWLCDNQSDDGAWDEHFYTGTGFPRVFYLKYHLYRHYFPLTALARFRRLTRQ
jgi:squalene-hopene/tetraprenyl-beta-curcumene cyclase